MVQLGEQCPACSRTMRQGLREWHRVCDGCTYEGSTLSVEIDTDGVVEVVDEARREEGLGTLRQRNFQVLASELIERNPVGAAGAPLMLDVGCAHGWFIEAVQGHFHATGIEPDARIAALAVSKGLSVRKGFFPDVLAADERFDVIVFNDVLEHIPDIDAALRACLRHLRPGGMVVVNAPARTGVLYQTSRWLARLGLPASFDRMWQHGFPSPHVHYLDDASMAAIAGNAGLKVSAVRTLPSMTARGLYARIRTDRTVSAPKALALSAALTLASPLLRLMPADIKVWLLQAV